MPRNRTPHPTEGELAILKVLWERGASTVQQVIDAMSLERSTGYTTTLKLMQIMHKKGLVTRDDTRWPHIYQARFRQEKTQSQILRRVLEKVFGGSAENLVLRLLSAKRVQPEELARIRRLIEEKEKGRA